MEKLANSEVLNISAERLEGSNPSSPTIPWESYSVYGPYKHLDGRKFVILTCPGHRKTTAYARYLMEVHLGRYLTTVETVDHINNNQRDDRIENLQLLSLADNIKKCIQPTCHRGHPKDRRTKRGNCKDCDSITRKAKRLEPDYKPKVRVR